MEDVEKFTGLVRRGSVYYYRVRMPKDPKDTFCKAQASVSLRTSDYATATNLAEIEGGSWAAAFPQARNDVQPAASDPGTIRLPTRPLTTDDVIGLAQRWFEREFRKRNEEPYLLGDMPTNQRDEVEGSLYQERSTFSDSGHPDTLKSTQQAATLLLEEGGLAASPDKPQASRLLHDYPPQASG